MSYENYSRDVRDRATEWVNENHPELLDDEWFDAFEAALRAITELDRAADAGGH